MRQDRRFQSGEGVSARYFARLLSQALDWLITMDPHLHRIHDPDEIFSVPVTTVHAAPQLAEWVRAHVPHPLLLGPDAESGQWVEQVAAHAGAPWSVLAKRRLDDEGVALVLPDLGGHAGRSPVLVDDIVSSGSTMAEAVRLLRAANWPAPVCLAVHPVFAPGAYQLVRHAGAAAIVSCNTLVHPSNAIDVHPLLADAAALRLQGLHAAAEQAAW
jgi:ribose-phosphate pyrophosphokinase